jgi:choline dehydrogenase
LIEMPDIPATSEIVVLGGGTAGCVVAGRLAARGHRVLLLEAGPDYGPRRSPAWPADLLDARTLPASHDWGYAGSGRGGQRLTFDRCRAIGGCSSHNGASQNVGWAGDYDAWAAAGSPGWDSASLHPLFERALAAFRVRRYADDEIQPFQRAFVSAAEKLGVPVRDDFDRLDGEAGVGCPPVSVSPDGTRLNAAFAYLDPVRDSGNLTVVGGVHVDRVVLAGLRAVGADVLVGGRRHRVTAHLVVLTAGTYGSPEVLLRSGIGPADDLADVGVPVRHHLPGVGENLHDHPAVQLEFPATAQLAAELARFSASHLLPAEQAIAKLRSPYAAGGPFDLHVYPVVARDDSLEHGWRCLMPAALLQPVARGRVRLRSADPRVRATIDHAYLNHPADVAALAYGLDWVRTVAEQGELGSFLGASLVTPAGDTGSWIAANHGHYWHPAGSCRMGPSDDPLAVVDHTGRVHGIDGLYLADASIFPNVPRGTTALPTTVVGERVAAYLREIL